MQLVGDLLRMMRWALRGALFLCFLGLAACQSGEERAEEHYQSAIALRDSGDFDRARVEFLNVFQNNGRHRGARSDFAAMLRDQGDLRGSYSQYLRLVEQYPDDVEGRIALAEMALQFSNWEEAARHGARVLEMGLQEDPRVTVIEVYLDYLDAIEEDDAPARRAAFDQAALLQAAQPDNLLLRRLEIDHLLREGDSEAALAELDLALEAEPDNRLLHDLRLALLVDLERRDAFEAQLNDMLERFPSDEELPGMLMRFYMAEQDIPAAIAFLYEQAEEAESTDTRNDALAALVQLRLGSEGDEAALAEIDRIITEHPDDNVMFRVLRASIQYDRGDSDGAVTALEAMLEEELSQVEQGQIRVMLARILVRQGNPVGARALVEQVLEVDSVNAEALKMQAAWLIEEDEVNRAISLLRSALDNNPDDSQALTLMAEAHGRNGNRDLAREFLSLAVEASNSAPAETLRYTATLVEQERYLIAEELLVDALRLAPANVDLLAALGELYIRMEDWPRAEQVENRLQEIASEAALARGDALRAQRLASQGRLGDAVAFLEQLASESGTNDLSAQLAVLRARLATGNRDGALSFAESLVEQAPDEPAYQLALAATQTALGDLAAAEASYRALTETVPQAQQAWLGLIRALNGQGRNVEAEAVLEDALAALPDALDLLWAQASFREQAGDIDGAIEIYELMYERLPNSEVIANNLASLLGTYRDDDESLERAWVVARRLRGIEIPPFQDTYGWLAYRRGQYDEALEHLEPAAAGLASDPVVQFHLGMAYLAVGRRDEALAQLRLAVELAGPDDPRPQFDIARENIVDLEADAGTEADQ